jgi:hypothetical protein
MGVGATVLAASGEASAADPRTGAVSNVDVRSVGVRGMLGFSSLRPAEFVAPDEDVSRPRWRHMCSELRGSEADNVVISLLIACPE